jgi:hypothetical protein
MVSRIRNARQPRLLVCVTLGDQIVGVAVEDVHVLGVDVDVLQPV